MDLLYHGTLGLESFDKNAREYQKTLAMLQSGAPRSTLWENTLNSQDFSLYSMKLRAIQEKSNIKVDQHYFFNTSRPLNSPSLVPGKHSGS